MEKDASIVDFSDSINESCASIVDSSDGIVDSSDCITDSSDCIVDSSGSIYESCASIVDSSASNIDSCALRDDSCTLLDKLSALAVESSAPIDKFQGVAALVLGAEPCLWEVTVRNESQLRALQCTKCKIASLKLMPLGMEVYSVPLLESLLRNLGPCLKSLDLSFSIPLSLIPLINSLPSLEWFACDDIELQWPGEAASPLQEYDSCESPAEVVSTYKANLNSEEYQFNFYGYSVPLKERHVDDVSGGLKHLNIRSCSIDCFPTVITLVRAHRSSLLSVSCGSRHLLEEPLGTLLSKVMQHMVLTMSACLNLQSVSVGLSENLGLLGELPLLRQLELQVPSPKKCHLLAHLPGRLHSLRLQLLFPLRKSNILHITGPLAKPCFHDLQDCFISVPSSKQPLRREMECLLKSQLPDANVSVKNEEGHEGHEEDDEEEEEQEEKDEDDISLLDLLSCLIPKSFEETVLSMFRNA